MNPLTEIVIDAAIEVQRRGIEHDLRNLKKNGITDFHPRGDGDQASSEECAHREGGYFSGPVLPSRTADGECHVPVGTIAIVQLVNLFEIHGCIPARELEAEGFDIKQLVDEKLIYRSPSYHDGGCYLQGSQLAVAIKGC